MGTSDDYSGRRVAVFVAQVLRVYGTTCHLCLTGPPADSADHLIPRSVDPLLTWDIGNARPAHKRCNIRRQAKPLEQWFRENPPPVQTPAPLPPLRDW